MIIDVLERRPDAVVYRAEQRRMQRQVALTVWKDFLPTPRHRSKRRHGCDDYVLKIHQYAPYGDNQSVRQNGFLAVN